jgi:hypothetical protein
VRLVTNALRDRGILRISVAAAFLLAGTAMLALILRDPRNRRPRVILTLLIVLALYALIILPLGSPEEKIHFIEYGIVALLAHTATPAPWTPRTRFIATALFVLAAGWIDEAIQALLPSRVYDLRDVAFNATAGLITLLALTALRLSRGVRPSVFGKRTPKV